MERNLILVPQLPKDKHEEVKEHHAEKEFNEIVKEPQRSFQFNKLPKVDQMAIINHVYNSFQRLFVEHGKEKILEILQGNAQREGELTSEDVLTIKYGWEMNAGGVQELIKMAQDIRRMKRRNRIKKRPAKKKGSK